MDIKNSFKFDLIKKMFKEISVPTQLSEMKGFRSK